MKSSDRITPKNCPKCGKEYTAPPSLSRVDGFTYICPECGMREALESIGVSKEEQDKIIGMEKQYRVEGGDDQ